MGLKFFAIICLILINQTIISVLGPQVDSCDLLSFLDKHDLHDEMEILKNEPFIAISLGENCYPAMHIKEHDIRIRSFPLDWNIISVPSLCLLIENDFAGILDLKNLVISNDMVFNSRYNFKLAHDFDTSDWYDGPDGLTPKDNIAEEDYKRILAYYNRRIARFYLVFNLDVPIYLFRRVINSDEAPSLYQLFKKKFPTSNFTLVCIQDGPWEPESNWENVEEIIYYRMDKHEEPTFKSGQRNEAWTSLFLNLGLLRS